MFLYFNPALIQSFLNFGLNMIIDPEINVHLIGKNNDKQEIKMRSKIYERFLVKHIVIFDFRMSISE